MSEALDVDDKSIEEVLEKGPLKIPRYQRQFTWDEGDLSVFFADLDPVQLAQSEDQRVDDPSENFLGEIVLRKTGRMIEGKRSREILEIVDGQQRLTTITILLATLRDHAYELRETYPAADRIASMCEKYIYMEDFGTRKQFRVLEVPSNGPDQGRFFREVVQERKSNFDDWKKKLPKSHLIYAAYKFFFEKIEERLDGISEVEQKFDYLHSLVVNVLQAIVIKVVLAKNRDAYMIFESLNDRGVPLAGSDLIKNTVLSRLDVEDGDGVDRALDAWMAVLDEVSSFSQKRFANFNDFLYYQWISRDYKMGVVQKKNLRKSVDSYLRFGFEARDDFRQKRARAEAYLHELEYDVKIWGMIADTSSATWKNAVESTELAYSHSGLGQVRCQVSGIMTCAGIQPVPAIMALLRRLLDGETSLELVRRALRAMESFHFRQYKMSQSSQGLRDAYRKFAASFSAASSDVEQEGAVEELSRYLEGHAVEPPVTIAMLKQLQYSSSGNPRSFLLYFLNRYRDAMELPEFEAYVCDPGSVIEERDFKIQFTDPKDGSTLEHIAPQKGGLFESPAEETLIQNIGNLTIVSDPKNVRLSNKDFSEKRLLLAGEAGKDPILSRCIDDPEASWSAREIEARAEHFAEVAVRNIWTFGRH